MQCVREFELDVTLLVGLCKLDYSFALVTRMCLILQRCFVTFNIIYLVFIHYKYIYIYLF